MSVTERVRDDRLEARKARDADRTGALTGLLAALDDAAKAAAGDLDGAAEVAVLRRERKRRAEAAASFREGGREADALREEAEGAIIEAYLPAQLSDDTLATLVDEAIAETGATSPRDLGAVMKLVLSRAGVAADGKLVSALVRARLGG